MLKLTRRPSEERAIAMDGGMILKGANDPGRFSITITGARIEDDDRRALGDAPSPINSAHSKRIESMIESAQKNRSPPIGDRRRQTAILAQAGNNERKSPNKKAYQKARVKTGSRQKYNKQNPANSRRSLDGPVKGHFP